MGIDRRYHHSNVASGRARTRTRKHNSTCSIRNVPKYEKRGARGEQCVKQRATYPTASSSTKISCSKTRDVYNKLEYGTPMPRYPPVVKDFKTRMLSPRCLHVLKRTKSPRSSGDTWHWPETVMAILAQGAFVHCFPSLQCDGTRGDIVSGKLIFWLNRRCSRHWSSATACTVLCWQADLASFHCSARVATAWFRALLLAL